MARREPLTQADIADRADWPEVQALRCGPGFYDQCEILTPKQRRALTMHARVSLEQEKQFVDALTIEISMYRLRKRVAAQEKPRAVAAAMQQVIEAYERVMEVLEGVPPSVKMDMLTAMQIGEPTAVGIERAKHRKLRVERQIERHCPARVTPDLIQHAQTLQRIACKFSTEAASDWNKLRRWLEIALIVSGEKSPGKNDQKGYFDHLMLPQSSDGAVDLSPRTPSITQEDEPPSPSACDLETKLDGVCF